jgi:hypothetical protein
MVRRAHLEPNGYFFSIQPTVSGARRNPVRPDRRLFLSISILNGEIILSYPDRYSVLKNKTNGLTFERQSK